MQLSDVLYWLYTASDFIAVVLAGAVTFRALEIRRVLVGGVYRRRASGIAALMVIAIIAGLTSSNTGLTTAPFFSTPVGSLFTALPLLLFFIAFYAFVDSNVLAAMEIDFFHRNMLHWRHVRAPFYGLMLFAIGVALALAYFTSNNLIYNFFTVVWVVIVFGCFGLVLGYSAAALVVISKRTPDSTLRRFVRLVGLGLVLFLISSVIWFLDVFVNYLGDVISGFFIIASTYLLYRAVMSLSPVGKLERQEIKQ